MTDKLPEEVTLFIKANMPAAEQLGFGGVMGYCSGMAFRRVGRAFGVVIGLGFMGAQVAASSGYVDINWNKVKDDAIKPFDTVRVHFGILRWIALGNAMSYSISTDWRRKIRRKGRKSLVGSLQCRHDRACSQCWWFCRRILYGSETLIRSDLGLKLDSTILLLDDVGMRHYLPYAGYT